MSKGQWDSKLPAGYPDPVWFVIATDKFLGGWGPGQWSGGSQFGFPLDFMTEGWEGAILTTLEGRCDTSRVRTCKPWADTRGKQASIYPLDSRYWPTEDHCLRTINNTMLHESIRENARQWLAFLRSPVE